MVSLSRVFHDVSLILLDELAATSVVLAVTSVSMNR